MATMKKLILIGTVLIISTTTLFAQELPTLKVTEREMNEVINRCAGDNETVVEVQSYLFLTFESTMDKTVNFCDMKQENGFYVYKLLFPTGEKYKGRKLKIKSSGFDSYTHPLDLKVKVSVGLLVLNETKSIADDLFNQGKFTEALKEYEKLYSINPSDDYIKGRIDVCSRGIVNRVVQKVNDDNINSTDDSVKSRMNQDDKKITNGSKTEEENNEPKLHFVFRGVEKKNNSSVKLYLDNQLIGETNINRGFQFKYTDTKPGVHELRAVWTNLEWSGIINTAVQTNFKFEYNKKKTGFGYKSYFELVND